MTLIELLAGMTVASLVGVVVTTALAATGKAVHLHREAVRAHDAPHMALGAMARDFQKAATWGTCTEARDCKDHSRPAYKTPLFFADGVGWLVDRGLRRCSPRCEVYAQDVTALEVFAYIADTDRPSSHWRRVRYLQLHEMPYGSLEAVLVMKDGRRVRRLLRTQARPQGAMQPRLPVAR